MLIGGGAAATRETPAAGGDVIQDVTLQTFGRDVIEASMKVPVLVDFWAPWCGPCKQLTPMLEKLVRQAKGKVRLAKINIDENPEIAQQLRIQSVPTVYAFVGGQPATGFAGAQPESQVKALIEKLAGPMGPADSEQLLAAAQAALDDGQLQEASQLFSAVLDEEEGMPDALGGLARCLIASGQFDEAQAVLDTTPTQHADHAAIAGARAALTLSRDAGEVGDPQTLSAALARDADDHRARYELATSLFLRGQNEAAIGELLTIIKKDRGWNDDGARRQLVNFFNALGPTHPATLKGRRMLSSLLFS